MAQNDREPQAKYESTQPQNKPQMDSLCTCAHGAVHVGAQLLAAVEDVVGDSGDGGRHRAGQRAALLLSGLHLPPHLHLPPTQ